MRALSLLSLFVPALPVLFGGCRDAVVDRPNVVLIVSDDQDYEHLGFLGDPWAHTPNLDRLAEEGVVFTIAHTQARCRPSLACLLSGRWPHQSGIYYNQGPDVLSPENSLPNLLSEAGYATYAGGKFWEGDLAAMGFLAPARPTRTFVREGQDDLFDFIERYAGKRPLFVWWGPGIPHMPHDAPERYQELIDRDAIALPEWFDGNAELYRRLEHGAYAMEAWLDDSVGSLIEEIRRAGILANTLFVFLIDNGWSNGLISKGSPYEKGVRTPIVFTWPGHIRPGRVGQLVSSIDVYPTVLDYAGVPIPAQAAGRSLRPLLEGGEWEPREVLCGAVYDRAASDGARPERDVFALYSRLEGWKYVLYVRDVPESMWLITEAKPLGRLGRREGEEELFDLEADPYELENLATDPEHGTLLKWMRNEALRWWKRTGGNDLEE